MQLKNNLYLTIGLFTGAVVLLAAFGLYPLFGMVIKNSQKIVEYRAQGALFSTQNIALEDFKKNYASYQKQLETVESFFVDSANPVAFIEFLETAAEASGVDVEIISVKSPDEKSALATRAVTFQVAAYGGFLPVLEFFQRAELGPYLVKVGQVSVRKPDVTATNEKNLGKGVVLNVTMEVLSK